MELKVAYSASSPLFNRYAVDDRNIVLQAAHHLGQFLLEFCRVGLAIPLAGYSDMAGMSRHALPCEKLT